MIVMLKQVELQVGLMARVEIKNLKFLIFNAITKKQINMSENKSMSVGDWLVTLLISAIPLVGLIMLFVWAFSDGENLSKKNWAKAALIFYAIFLVFCHVFRVYGCFGLLSKIKNYCSPSVKGSFLNQWLVPAGTLNNIL